MLSDASGATEADAGAAAAEGDGGVAAAERDGRAAAAERNGGAAAAARSAAAAAAGPNALHHRPASLYVWLLERGFYEKQKFLSANPELLSLSVFKLVCQGIVKQLRREGCKVSMDLYTHCEIQE